MLYRRLGRPGPCLADPDLLEEIVDNLLLILVDPACKEDDNKSWILCHNEEDTKISGPVSVNGCFERRNRIPQRSSRL